MHFGKELYMFWTDLLSIIRSRNTVFTAIGICHTAILKMGKITSVCMCVCVCVCVCVYIYIYTGLFISPSGTSELDCATTKTDTAERSISIGRESLKFFFVLGALAYLQVPPLGGSRDEKWRAQ